MSQIQPVSPARHRSLRWRRYANYQFTASTNVVPLAAAEISQAGLVLPLAFVQREDSWSLVAVLGLQAGQNLYIDANGIWMARYVPAAFRAYPFLIGTQATGEPTLCVDEASGLVTEGPEGEPFFDDAGELSPTLAQVWTFLVETARSEAALMEGCERLAEAGVIEPWPITLQGDHGEQQVVGLHRVNEVALNALDNARNDVLRSTGLVGVAYTQLLSMGNLAQLGQLAQARARAEAAMLAQTEAPPMMTLPEDNTIDWDWSKIGR